MNDQNYELMRTETGERLPNPIKKKVVKLLKLFNIEANKRFTNDFTSVIR